jgi:hypothetical protein
MVTYQPPGLRDYPGEWYVCVYLETMVDLLHAVGYGSFTEPAYPALTASSAEQ